MCESDQQQQLDGKYASAVQPFFFKTILRSHREDMKLYTPGNKRQQMIINGFYAFHSLFSPKIDFLLVVKVSFCKYGRPEGP